MAAVVTLPHLKKPHNSVLSRHGVLTLWGYGIDVRVQQGHLTIQDGVGSDRRRFRLPRVGHGLTRLVVIGEDGLVSLSALRWLSDQNAAFVMLNRHGSVLATTVPVGSSDPRLRRAQALAHESGAALRISRELIDQKIAGQQEIASELLHDQSAMTDIKKFRSELAEAESIDAVRLVEARAAKAYWTAWQQIAITFAQKDLPRVPEHWRRFDSRLSPITGSQRLAANPINAMLNYLYALLEAEARLAAAALGFDPGLGFLHVDTTYRDSLACDLMEPIRPEVDAFVLSWILREPVAKDWFFEQPNGNCRLMAPFAARLSETAPTWARLVAPFAEWIAHALGNQKGNSQIKFDAPTKLTGRRKSEGRGNFFVNNVTVSRPPKLCRTCSKEITRGKHCSACALVASRERFSLVALKWHATPKDSRHKKHSIKRITDHAVAITWWDPNSLPKWLTEDFYAKQIQPKLKPIRVAELSRVLGVSKPYAGLIRSGKSRPHPRHWKKLSDIAQLGHSI